MAKKKYQEEKKFVSKVKDFSNIKSNKEQTKKAENKLDSYLKK